MAKKLNKNVVVGLSMLGFAAIIGLSVFMITQLQQDDPKHYVELAKKYKGEGDLKRAASLYRRAWEIGNSTGNSEENRKAPEYLVSEGEIWLEMGDLRRAVASWGKAVQVNPQLISAHERQLNLLLDIAKLRSHVQSWIPVRDAAEALLQVDEGNAAGQNALGLALVNLRTQDPGYLAKGVAALTRACELAPEKVEYSLDLATYYSSEARRAADERKGDPAVAEWIVKFDTLMQQLLARFNQPGADAPKVHSLYATWLMNPKYFHFLGKPYDASLAEKHLQEAVALAGDLPEASVDAKIGYSSYLLTQYIQKVRKAEAADEEAKAGFAKATELLKECIAAQPDRFEPYLQIAVAYQLDEQYEEALKYCEQRLQRKIERNGLEAEKQRFGAFGLHRIASECALSMSIAEADAVKKEALLKRSEQYIADALGEVPEHPEGHRQSGKIKWIRGQDREALELFRKADDGFTAFGRIDWQTKIILAKVHSRLGEPGSARKVLEDVLPQARFVRADDVEYWTLYARVLNDAGEIQRAVEAADAAVTIAPTNQEAINLRAAARMRLQGQQPDLAKLKEGGDEGKFVAAILEAEQARVADNIDGVIEHLKEALKIRPDHEPVLRRAIAIMISRNDAPGARTLVEEAIAFNPGSQNLKKLLVATRRDLSLPEREHALLEVIEAQTDAYAKNNDLAEFYYNKGELPKALTAINEAEKCLIDESKATDASREAGKAGHRELLARKMLIAAKLDNQEALKEAAKSASLHNVDGANGYTFQGQYHMYREEADQAINAFLEALRVQPTDARLLTFLGRCYQNQQRTDDAQQYFERALESNPNEGLAHKGMAQLTQAAGDTAAYEKHLTRCMELIPDDLWVAGERRTRAEESDPASAIKEREERLAANPNDAENLRRLAYLCEKSGDLTKAEQYITGLFEVEKKDENLVLVLSTFYHRIGKPDKALETLQAHVDSRTTPEDKGKAMIWVAAHYMKLNQPDKMERTLLDAADLAKTFEVCRALGDFYMRVQRPQDALPWLDQAIDRGRLAKSPQLPLAYSARIASLLHPSYNDLTAARQRVEEFRRTYPQDPRGLYWEAEIFARDGDIEKAVASLTAYLDMRPNNPSALVQRARYFMGLGRTAQAIGDLEAIRNHDPKALELQPRILLAKLYESTGAKDKAFLELENAVDKNPDSQHALLALIGLYTRDKRFTEAEQRITAAINRAADGKPNPALFRERARVSRDLGDKERAISDLKRVVELTDFDAGEIVDLLSEYKNAGKSAEGLKFCTENAQKMTSTSSSVAMHASLLADMKQEVDAGNRFRDAMQLAVAEGQGRSGFIYSMILAAWDPCRAVDLFTKQACDPALVRANDRILAGIMLKCGKIDQVPGLLTRLKDAAATPAERAELMSQQGQLLQQLNKFEEAAKVYEEALKYNDRDAIALNNLAYLLSDQLKQSATALPYARKAAALMPSSPNIIDTLGWIYFELGQYDQAVAELTRAVAFEDAPPDSWYHLGEAYRLQGKFGDAQNILDKEARPRAKAAGDDALLQKISAALKRASTEDKAP